MEEIKGIKETQDNRNLECEYGGKYGILMAQCYQNIIKPDDHTKKITQVNIGNIFEINDNKFVLSCYHCIKNAYSTTLVLGNNKSYECSVVSTAPELELGLLSISNQEKETGNMFTLDSFDVSLSGFKENQVFKIGTCDINKYIGSSRINKTNEINKMDLECTFYDIIQSSHISLNMPKMPFIRVNLNDKYNDISQLSGISGSIVRLANNNKIIGIVSSIIDTHVYIIPSCCIVRFLSEFKQTGQFKGISSLVLQYNACMFDPHELPSNSIYGIFVNNTYGIKSNLLKNDVIIQINGNPITVNNKIYDKSAKTFFDFNVYVALNFKCGDQIPLKIARLKKGSQQEYKEKDIIIDARSLNSTKYIPIEFNRKTYEFANMTFIELSEDIINHYIDLGIFTGKSINDKYIDTPYRNTENNFVVVMINIDKSKLSSKLKKTVAQIGLPLVPIQNRQYSFTIIKKINGNNVSCIEDLIKNSGNNTTDVIMNASIESYGKLNMTIKNGDIISIIKGK